MSRPTDFIIYQVTVYQGSTVLKEKSFPGLD